MALVTQAEAARRLGVNRSTVSRWVKSNPAFEVEKGKVDLDALRHHQTHVLNPGNQTKGETAPQTTDFPAPAPDDQPKRAEPRINDHRERRELARATNEELDLAERMGSTLRREEVAVAAADAGEALRQAAFSVLRDRAERLTRIDDVREMELALQDAMTEALTRGAKALLKLAGQDEGGDDAAAA